MNERIRELWVQAGYHADAYDMFTNIEKFAELVWKAAYEEGHDVGIDAGFAAGRNASFTEQHFGVEE